MFKTFTESDDWELKRNFVDDNNVFVGYDLRQSCCENADWFIADEVIKDKISPWSGKDPDEFSKPEYLDGYRFDQDWFKKIDHNPDAGNRVIFRLVNDDGEEKFLHLFNVHNGYYGHGFEFEIDDETVESDYI
jgi:hypothetical protein